MLRLIRYIGVVLLLANCQVVVAQVLKTRYGNISINQDAQSWFDSIRINSESDYYRVLLSFNNIPTIAERKALISMGIFVDKYVCETTYESIVRVKSDAPFKVPGIISGIATYNDDWKVENSVFDVLPYNKTLELYVSFTEEMDANVIEAFIIDELNAVVDKTSSNTVGVYHINIPASSFDKLKAYHAVRSISLSRNPVSLNYEAKAASKANIANLSAIYGGYGLNGDGVTVGIGDNSASNYHIDLKDRVINYNSQPYANHGVHITGIAGGAGIVNLKGEGVATASRFINHLFSKIWEETGAFHDQYNMTLTNNSYAAVIRDCDYAGTYNTYSEAIDKLSLKYKDVLHVFAAGNDGFMTCNPFPSGYGTVVGAYQTAKNCLVVTSTDKNYINAKDGGRGPIKDGRLKPEITAVGVDVYSTTRVDSYFVSGGTSMACPGVTGGLALLTERYKQLNSNVNPPADVLKALVLNTSTDIGNPGPDFRFGFGFMNIARAIKALNNNQYVSGTVGNGGQQVYNVNVPPNTAKLKVMLLWFDEAASVLATKQLVNDLDIEVETPSSLKHKPLVLDPLPANILNNAVEGIDRLNNTEQVVIEKPQAGTYSIFVKGFYVPTSSQSFILTYDFIEEGIQLTYPTTSAQVANADSLRIYWDASDNNSTQRIEFSADGGSVWQVIANNIPSEQRHFVWYVPGNINSGKCMMKIVRNATGEQNISGLFAINTIPIVLIDAIQCPEYININWQQVPNASSYEVMMKVGPTMKVIDTVTATSYVYSGLSPDSVYYVAVRPIIDGMSGYRSLAIKRIPNDGNCIGSVSDGDLSVRKIIKPLWGRLFTGNALTNNEVLEVMVKNLDDVPANSLRISYRINGAVWKSKDFTVSMPANNTTNIKVDTVDMSSVGLYKLELAIQNLSITDPVSQNDTLKVDIRQFNNQQINLGNVVNENFESIPIIESTEQQLGLGADERWDYTNANDTCRFRSFVKNEILISGNRSISLDAILNTNNNHRNEFTGTYNLSGYNVQNEELRIEFEYLLHGYAPDADSNALYARGNDTDAWKKMFSYDMKNAGTGKVSKSGSLSLTDLLLASAQNFTSSAQLRFMQNDISLISMRNFGRGLTIDNVKMYTVQNDIQLLSIVSPITSECGISGEFPLTIKLRNGVNQQLTNIQLYYKLDNNPVVSEAISNINGKETIAYTFNKRLNLDIKGGHILDVWIKVDGDTYLANDSILNFEFNNQPLIISYPYFENFETTEGGWYSNGIDNSWQYGVIASKLINKAASGIKGWKTNLTGIYNDGEQSFLYSPCFDISSLQKPTLRFKRATDIEYCGGVFCDGAFMEYSIDGNNWAKLGKWTDGSNWYNDTLNNLWSIENSVSWQSSSILLPSKLSNLRLRYQFVSDMGAEREGLAIDDVEIFDDLPEIVEDNLLNIVPNPTKDGKVTIDWTAHGGTIMELAVFNIVGKKVYEAKATAKEGRNYTTLQTPNFQSGVYLYHIIIGDKKFTRKIVYL